jgi:predicted dehydrogenase
VGVSSREKSTSYVIDTVIQPVYHSHPKQPAVQASKDLILRAIYSRSLKSAESVVGNAKDVTLYSNDSGEGKGLDDLLERSDIKAVIIALPIKNQPEYIKKCLLAGKHVLSEKPVAENVKDAKELIKWYHEEIDTKKVTWGVAGESQLFHLVSKS